MFGIWEYYGVGGGVREGFEVQLFFSPHPHQMLTDSKWSGSQRTPPFCWRRHTSGPLGEGQLFLVKKPETRPIASFLFCFSS